MSSCPRGIKHLPQLKTPVREAMQCLENAGLAQARGTQGTQRLYVTSLGETALREGTFEQYLAGAAG